MILSFQKMIDVNIPIIYIHDFDFARVDSMISEVVGRRDIIEWNPATGPTDFKFKRNKGGNMRLSLEDFLREEYIVDPMDGVPTKERFIVLKEIQDYIEGPGVKTLLQLIAQRKLYDRQFEKTIIIVSSVQRVPEELQKYVSYLEVTLPKKEEINALIDHHIEVNGYNNFKDEDREKLMPSLQGMTAYEIDRMLDMAMSSNGSLNAEDKGMILQQKKQMVRKSGVLELVDTPESIESIGGLNYLKDYLKKKHKVFENLSAAQKFGVAVPKGIFLVGMPGCGKSLCAKATAALFEAPLLKMDMGSMMGKYVGESEANLRKAIMIAEASAPCVLWIDEIEKAFSGVGGHNDIMTRMFGYFLGWMQDKKSAVYVVATANNADSLPPELKRKGRFDEIFCVDLPDREERSKIFEVHLNKKGKKMMDNDRKTLADVTEGFNGADIEAVVNETYESCFLSGKKEVTVDELKKIVNQTISISKSCRKQIDSMKKIFEESSFKDASTGKIKNYNKK